MNRLSRRLRAVAIAVALLAAAGATLTARTARAQALLERFEPAERGSRFFMADSLELDGHLHLATGVVTSYGSRLRTFRQSGTNPEASGLVEHSVWIHPGASLVLAPGARFALDVPIALQSGSDVALDRTLFRQAASPRLGDLRGSFDLRLFGRERGDIDGGIIAAGVSAYLPTGSADAYTGDDFTRFDLHAAGAGRIGHGLLAVRVGYMFRKDDLPDFGGVRLGSELNAVLAAGYRTESVVVGPELHALTTLKTAFERKNTPLEALLGAHVSVADFRLGAGIGTLLVSGLGAPKLRGVFSIEWSPGGVVPADRDHDGVMDADDLCPDVPGLASAPLGARGCPAPPLDGDHDGIIDTEDACPDLPGIRSRDPMTHGCPDTDRDGIPDPLDACPNVSGERSVLPRFHGCPPDADGDGVVDLQDACPDDPGVPTTDEHTNGCPLPAPPPDRDADGVLDPDDACPDDKGFASSTVTSNGCPVVRLAGEVLELDHVIEVASKVGQRPVRFVSEEAFADLANFLILAHPEITRVRVTGRQAEAQAVVEKIVSFGVARKRFEVRGVEPPKSRRFELRVVTKP